MPTYEYACTECGDQTEVVQKFSDDPLTVCMECGGRLRKVFSPVGIVFKGAGFYRTDSRAAAKEPAVATQKPNGSEAGAKSSGDSKSEASTTAGANGSGSSSGGGSGSVASSGSASSGSASSGSASSDGASSGGRASGGGSGAGGSRSGGKSSSTKVA
ncbi:MAG TPA: FmdB family zinc ribbon protein [Streptosporangiaceae bacterium]|nr:FmdB family zinc ribbon protein [Streptosporangiaceae bacterium]